VSLHQVKCSTFHSIAWNYAANVGYRAKLSHFRQEIQVSLVQKLFKLEKRRISAQFVIKTLHKFLWSADDVVMEHHVPHYAPTTLEMALRNQGNAQYSAPNAKKFKKEFVPDYLSVSYSCLLFYFQLWL
jgi:arginine utilization protein RocB